MIFEMINEASKVNNKVIALIGCDKTVTSIINSADFGHKLIFSFDWFKKCKIQKAKTTSK